MSIPPLPAQHLAGEDRASVPPRRTPPVGVTGERRSNRRAARMSKRRSARGADGVATDRAALRCTRSIRAASDNAVRRTACTFETLRVTSGLWTCDERMHPCRHELSKGGSAAGRSSGGPSSVADLDRPTRSCTHSEPVLAAATGRGGLLKPSTTTRRASRCASHACCPAGHGPAE